MIDELEGIWTLLEEKIRSGGCSGNRIYRRLDLENETGLRLGVLSTGNVREFLIQIYANDEHSFVPPKWMGMRFETIMINAPQSRTRHIRLYLEDREHKSVFTTVCADIAETLLRVEDPATRTKELQNCLDRWSRFFQKYGVDGLSSEAQCGLFGELTWLELLLTSHMNPTSAIESWKGCRRAHHDFELSGRVVEVKTTMTKEPRRVRINNERQLDNQGLDSLYLYILTLHKIDSGGHTLPELVNAVRGILMGDTSTEARFERALKEAGYLDIHIHLYTSRYILKNQEIFEVGEGFPRIIRLPTGIGDVSYSLIISACSNFEVGMEKALTEFVGGENDR